MTENKYDPTLDPMVGYRDGYEDGEKAMHTGDMAELDDLRTMYTAREMTGYQLSYCEGFQDGYDDAAASLFGRDNEDADDEYDWTDDEDLP